MPERRGAIGDHEACRLALWGGGAVMPEAGPSQVPGAPVCLRRSPPLPRGVSAGTHSGPRAPG